jgi:hypothetical protein
MNQINKQVFTRANNSITILRVYAVKHIAILGALWGCMTTLTYEVGICVTLVRSLIVRSAVTLWGFLLSGEWINYNDFPFALLIELRLLCVALLCVQVPG